MQTRGLKSAVSPRVICLRHKGDGGAEATLHTTCPSASEGMIRASPLADIWPVAGQQFD